MTYSESQSDFSFAVNLVSDFDSASKSDPNSGSEFCIFLNKPADGVYYPFS